MKKSLVEAWLLGLRSGEYKQGKIQLVNDPNAPTHFCCLGVACVVNGVSVHDTFVNGYEKLKEWFEKDNKGRRGYIERQFWYMNDIENKTFLEIADWIEQNILPNATEE